MSMSKKQFLSTAAHPNTKQASLIALILGAVAVVLIFASILTVLNGSLLNIPVVSMALSSTNADKEELTEELEDAVDSLEDLYELKEDDLSSSEKDAVEQTIEAAKDLSQTFSVANLQKLTKTYEKLSSEFSEEVPMDDVKSISEVCSIISAIAWIAFVPALLLAALAVLCKSKGLTIAALIFTAIPQALLCSFLWVILSAIANIGACIFHGKVTADYRSYCAAEAAE